MKVINRTDKVLILKAHTMFKDEMIEVEQKRIADLTGLKVCIVKAQYSIEGIQEVANQQYLLTYKPSLWSRMRNRISKGNRYNGQGLC